ncbi:hypothetical protein AMTRI_Chr02g255020 [Amborella trichopoda]
MMKGVSLNLCGTFLFLSFLFPLFGISLFICGVSGEGEGAGEIEVTFVKGSSDCHHLSFSLYFLSLLGGRSLTPGRATPCLPLYIHISSCIYIFVISSPNPTSPPLLSRVSLCVSPLHHSASPLPAIPPFLSPWHLLNLLCLSRFETLSLSLSQWAPTSHPKELSLSERAISLSQRTSLSLKHTHTRRSLSKQLRLSFSLSLSLSKITTSSFSLKDPRLSLSLFEPVSSSLMI